MKSGRMDRLIEIHERVETQNDTGEVEITYQLLKKAWAEVLPISGREFFVAAQTVPEATLKMRTRFIDGINEKCRIVYNNLSYDILYIAEIGRREGWEIMVKKP